MLEGELGEKIRKNIAFNVECPHFITNDSEKCPFLNENGLCDIITELGEDALCEICDQHPRFRNFFSDRVEIGIGLCCEAATEIVLSWKEPFRLVELEGTYDEDEQESLEERNFFTIREGLLSIMQERAVSVLERLEKALEEIGYERFLKSKEELSRLFSSLEYMDSEFGAQLSEAFLDDDSVNVEEEWEFPLENLAVYFIMRHTADAIYGDDIRERVAFCALCVEAILRVSVRKMRVKNLNFFDALCDTARVFSTEIEYSTENTERIIEAMS